MLYIYICLGKERSVGMMKMTGDMILSYENCSIIRVQASPDYIAIYLYILICL